MPLPWPFRATQILGKIDKSCRSVQQRSIRSHHRATSWRGWPPFSPPRRAPGAQSTTSAQSLRKFSSVVQLFPSPTGAIKSRHLVFVQPGHNETQRASPCSHTSSRSTASWVCGIKRRTQTPRGSADGVALGSRARRTFPQPWWPWMLAWVLGPLHVSICVSRPSPVCMSPCLQLGLGVQAASLPLWAARLSKREAQPPLMPSPLPLHADFSHTFGQDCSVDTTFNRPQTTENHRKNTLGLHRARHRMR